MTPQHVLSLKKTSWFAAAVGLAVVGTFLPTKKNALLVGIFVLCSGVYLCRRYRGDLDAQVVFKLLFLVFLFHEHCIRTGAADPDPEAR